MDITKEQYESLTNFVFDVLQDWQDGGAIDMFDIQDIAVSRKILIPTTVYEPCTDEGCNCSEFYSDEDWKSGVSCYRLVDWLRRSAEQRDGADNPIPAARYCSECKALLEDRSVYCDVCGTDAPLP